MHKPRLTGLTAAFGRRHVPQCTEAIHRHGSPQSCLTCGGHHLVILS